MKSEIQINNTAGVCQIDIEGTIGVPEEWQFEEPDARVATYERFRDTLRRIAEIEAPEVVVNIRSTGGDVNDALLIHDALRQLPARVTTRCYGYTASAATIIAQAASEGCRLIATCPAGEVSDAYEGYVRRRLGSIPQQDNFHVHGSGCTWDISLEGDEETDRVSVTIGNQVKPLPFFDFGARALGVVNDKGNFEITVHFSVLTKSSWVVENDQGLNPKAWVASDGSTAGRGTS